MRLKSLFSLAALAALALSGCQKQPEAPVAPVTPDRDAVVFSGSFAQAPGSKTSLGDESQGVSPVLWSGGDALGVFTFSPGAVAENARASLMEGAGNNDGKFAAMSVGMAETGNVFYLYYPYNRDALSGNSGGVNYFPNGGDPYITATLPDLQEQPAAGDLSHFGTYGYSVAISDPADRDDEVSFSMKHILSHLKLSLWSNNPLMTDYSIEQIRITATGGQYLSGPLRSDFEGNYEAVNAPATDFSNTITLEITRRTAITLAQGEAQQFLMTLLPVDLTGEDLRVEVQVRREGDLPRVYTQTFEGADFAGGKMLKITENFTKWPFVTHVSESNETFVSNLLEVQRLAAEYSTANPSPATNYVSATHADWLTATYLRQFNPGYHGGNWPETAGTIDANFTAYVQAQAPDVHTYFANTASIAGTDGGDEIDLYHMGATLSALTFNATGTRQQLIGHTITGEMSGWAGDLQDFLRYNIVGAYPTGDETFYYNKTMERMGQADTYFSVNDLLGDADAVNLYGLMKASNNALSLASCAAQYYSTVSSCYLKRFTSYVQNTAGNTTRSSFFTRVNMYTKLRYAGLIVWPLYSGMSSISPAQEKGVANGYCDYIFNLIAKE